MSANISVGAKHDGSHYGIITNNLYAVRLRPLFKSEMHPFYILFGRSNRIKLVDNHDFSPHKSED